MRSWVSIISHLRGEDSMIVGVSGRWVTIKDLVGTKVCGFDYPDVPPLP